MELRQASFEDIVRHEMSHAFVAYTLGAPIIWFEMYSPGEPGGEWGGSVRSTPETKFDKGVIAMAGPAADHHWDVVDPTTEQDRNDAHRYLPDAADFDRAARLATATVEANAAHIERLTAHMLIELHSVDLTRYKTRIEPEVVVAAIEATSLPLQNGVDRPD